MPSRIVTGCVLTLLATPGWANDEWSQFRGPNSSGHAGIQPAVPVAFGPDHNVRWKCSIPRGVSSPCVRGNRIFVTSFESEKSELKVICIGRENGDIKWQATVPADKVERVHKTSNPANATIVADDQRIYAYFASSGIFCFDHDGNPVWDHRLPTARRFNGSGTSPILAANQVILNREDNREAYLLALNPETG